jgi:hypothetical protein
VPDPSVLRFAGMLCQGDPVWTPEYRTDMSGEVKTEGGVLLKRVPVIVRSWDGPNSRLGLEMDLGQMPWGPFDALGKRLSLILPASEDAPSEGTTSESQVERALRHVEHAADRCAEFAQLSNGNQELWLRSQATWEWIRKYLTSLWVETEVEGREPLPGQAEAAKMPPREPDGSAVLSLPGAASTLRVAAKALRATPLAVWRETMGPLDPDIPTREEAVQTLLGVARILGTEAPGEVALQTNAPNPSPNPEEEPTSLPEQHPPHGEEVDPDQLSFEFARGYDEGYQLGRRVGLALGSKRPPPSQAT